MQMACVDRRSRQPLPGRSNHPRKYNGTDTAPKHLTPERSDTKFEELVNVTAQWRRHKTHRDSLQVSFELLGGILFKMVCTADANGSSSEAYRAQKEGGVLIPTLREVSFAGTVFRQNRGPTSHKSMYETLCIKGKLLWYWCKIDGTSHHYYDVCTPSTDHVHNFQPRQHCSARFSRHQNNGKLACLCDSCR
jgi:hypothetical protein